MSDLNFVEVDAREIWIRMLAKFEGALSTPLEATDERRIYLQQILQVIISLYSKLNFTGRMTLLRYATGDFLDAIGDSRGVPRLKASSASTTLRFSLQTTRGNNVLIPSGTKATTNGGNITFATTTTAVIPAGQISVSVNARATETGELGNDYAPGQIVVLVDQIPYVYSVTNLTTTAGGASSESDDSYKQRIRLSEARTSTAGSIESYQYWASTANAKIIDVSVTSPSPGVVSIVPLMEAGEIPEDEVITEVMSVLSEKEIRPLTDNVIVEKPTVTEYNIDFDYYAPLSQAGIVQQAVEGTGGAIDQYAEWQRESLNRKLNPDYLKKLLFEAGATGSEIRSPVRTENLPTDVFHENISNRRVNYIPEDAE